MHLGSLFILVACLLFGRQVPPLTTATPEESIMASVRKQKLSPHWFAVVEMPNGIRTNLSTGVLIDAPTRDERNVLKDQALEISIDLNRAARLAKTGGLTHEVATEMVNKILRCAGGEEINTLTTRQFTTDWLAGKSNEGTNARYSHVAELFLGHIDELADQSIRKVLYPDILSFIAMRRASGAAPKTIAVDVKALSNMFNLARRLGKITVNPVDQALALQPITL